MSIAAKRSLAWLCKKINISTHHYLSQNVVAGVLPADIQQALDRDFDEVS
jgi:hypothetical protein